MKDFKPATILCPVDFSDLAALALQYAELFSRCWGAHLIALYADPFLPPPHFTAGQVEKMAKSLANSKLAAKESLASFVRQSLGSAGGAETAIVESLPVPAIVSTAVRRAAGLIVMGTHGRSGVSRLMLGSVTERVMRETDCPLLTVRPVSRFDATPGIKRVLCPVNYTNAAHSALDNAISISECFGAELVALHVAEPDATDEDEAREREKLCAWVPHGVHSRCSLKEIVRRGDAAEQIIEAARVENADLIVIGAQHKTFSDTTVIGTTTVRVIRHSHCPVLTVVTR